MDIPKTPITPPIVPGKPKKKRWPLIIWLVAIIIVAAYGTLFLGINVFSWRNLTATRISQYIPVPVAMVGWHAVWASDVLTETTALAHYQAYEKSNNLATGSTADAHAAAITKAIKDLALLELTRANKLTVTPAEVDQSYETQLTQSGATSNITQALDQLYGWQPKQFKKYVITMDVQRDKLMEKYSFDPTLSAPIKKQADTVRALVAKDGKNFADLAKQYSQDAYATNGGETDFINRGDLTKELEDVAFNAAVGSVSDVIHTKYGFHIIQIVERKGTGDTAQVKIRSIFFAAPSVDDAISKYLSEHRVWILSSGVKWDKTAYEATSTKAATDEGATNTNTAPANTNASTPTNTNTATNTNS